MPTLYPNAPGVYFFKDSNNVIIYVGKANSLKQRLSSYFQKNHDDWKIKALVDDHAHIEYIVTHNETEALLLEAQLIHEHQPKYNVLLKSGQPFVYILFTKTDKPTMKLVRNKKEKGTYFGPFIHKNAARKVFQFLQRTFQLIPCNQTIENGCLQYHVGICPGSCKGIFDQKDYLLRLNLAMDVLKEDHGAYKEKIKNRIVEHNHNLEFEKSRSLNEYLINIDSIFNVIETNFRFHKFADHLFPITTPFSPAYDTTTIAELLQTFLQLQKPVITVDCFDISHFQSRSIVGASVRFTHGMPDKQSFRRFQIKSLETQNDYAALQEIVQRRYRNPVDIPDVILIDGGKGQRNAVKHLFPNSTCISLAKKEEIIYGDRYPEGIMLDLKTAVGQFFIALRDYTHYFAISYHKYKRGAPLRSK
jgi:excinuclease ABC subunit C